MFNAIRRFLFGPSTYERLQEEAKRLGALEADEIASFLAERGVKGHRSSPSQCVLAVYFSNLLGEKVTVGGTYATVERKSVTLPKNVTTFVGRFDGNVYPALVATN